MEHVHRLILQNDEFTEGLKQNIPISTDRVWTINLLESESGGYGEWFYISGSPGILESKRRFTLLEGTKTVEIIFLKSAEILEDVMKQYYNEEDGTLTIVVSSNEHIFWFSSDRAIQNIVALKMVA